jgi:hypothetical protein
MITLLNNNNFNLNKDIFCKLNEITTHNETINPGKFRITNNLKIYHVDNFVPINHKQLNETFENIISLHQLNEINNTNLNFIIKNTMVLYGMLFNHNFLKMAIKELVEYL